MRTPIEKCYGRNWRVIAKGKAMILALSELERKLLFNNLDVDQREMLSRISRTVYVSR